MTRKQALWFVFVLLIHPGCAGPRAYPVKGRVVAIAANRQSVTLAHEAIPGYMSAMTMPFPVKDTKLLDGVEPGDEIEGELTVTSSEGWLSHLTVTKKAGPKPPPDRSKAVPVEYLLNPGDDIPDIELINQDGRRFRLSDMFDKTVALTFLFTRCPFPNFCPLMSKRFVEAQDLLKARDPQVTDKVRFLTISFDPEYDTPEVLKEYGKRYNADFHRWTFATSSLEAIGRFGASFGLSFWTEQGTINHNLATAVIRPGGKLHAILRGNEWATEELVKELEAAK